MGRVPKQPFPDSVRTAFITGMPFGSDEALRKKKHTAGMLYRLGQKDPGTVAQGWLDEITDWLKSQGIDKVRPLAQGAERAVFEDGDRVVKLGIGRIPGQDPNYRPPEGVWGVTPWLADTKVGPFSVEVQPRVDLIDPTMKGTVRRRPGYADIRALRDALQSQGWDWLDRHIGNVGFVPGKEYKPTVIDGSVYATQYAGVDESGKLIPKTVPATFVPPTGPKYASLLAALVAGLGAAGTSGTVKAGENETLADYLRRMQPTVGPEPDEPGMAETVGRSVLPRPFQEIAGIAKPLGSFSRDFPEMEEYTQRATNIWNTPSIRVGEQLVSPGDFYASKIMDSFGGDSEGMEDAKRLFKESGLKQLVGGEPLTPSLRETLETLKAQGVGGKEELFPGQTLAQREARRKDPLQEGRYITSENMDKNLLATRAYNLLTAMRDEEEFKPDFSSATSAVHSVLGSVLNPGTRAVEGDPGSDTRSLAYNRNIESVVNPARARAKEAIYWDKLADQQRSAGTYRDGMFGGYYPQFSWTTGVGAGRQGEQDNANLNTYWGSTLVPQYFSGTPVLGLPGSDSIRTLAYNLRREVPIVPEGMPADEAAKARKQLDDYFSSQENQYAQNKPIRQRNWNDAMDNLADAGLPTSGLKFNRFSFPAPLENTLATAHQYYLDPMTVMTLGGGMVRNAGRMSAKAYGKAIAGDFIADQPFETGISAGLHSLNKPYSSDPMALITTSMPYSTVTDRDGKPADPNSPTYPADLARHRAEQEKLLGGLIDTASQYYGTRKPQGGRNGGRGSSTQ